MKLILPPRVRARWLLTTIRLSIIALAGTARTLVAVGISNDSAMFFAMAAAGPRSTLLPSAFSDFWPSDFPASAALALPASGLVGLGCDRAEPSRLATLWPDAAFVAVDSLAGAGLRGAVRAGV